ncbi:MAG TPA: glycoside hydrolase family 15 protein [Kofleriaceae bacterium]|nr:glycoside hydrolase family 15 protein [Kofleriaceae bacterium]
MQGKILTTAGTGPHLATIGRMLIEDYAVVGDTQTMALVGRDGSVDWLCFPRFDSGACFAALLGRPEHGRWRLAPAGEVRAARRRYRDDTMILETELETEDGVVRLIDFMPIRGQAPDLVRIVEGVRGRVPVDLELMIRFDYGSVLPWIRERRGRVHAIAGADALVLATPVDVRRENHTIVGRFAVERGDRIPFVLTWHPSYGHAPPSPDAEEALADTEKWWRAWVARADLQGPYRDAEVRSLLTLKALTYGPSGGIVAAATTSLPEALGGSRNWDYRYCWLRDSTFTLQALLHAGYPDEARAWREWLLRAIAGEPAKLQILYGVTGERRIDEQELDWLPGYEGARPVRIGNKAVAQRQLDVYGELMDTLYVARGAGLRTEADAWSMQSAALDWLECHWDEPDAGMWEVRGDPQPFTTSKVMAWAAFDRAVRTVEQEHVDGPIDRWRAVRDRIHAEVCARGFDRARGTFVQAFGREALDAGLLLMPIVGFLPGTDPRVVGTIDAIQRELVEDGLVQRYHTSSGDNADGLRGREGAFLACSFWLVDALVLAGRRREATELFERLLAIRNDVGLLAEEYDTRAKRMVGNFPQAFSHVGLINSARNLSSHEGPAHQRARRSG